ncbi:hypothetical protein F937_03583 [Acinetobacter calcoaceticus ANC 3680]|nr:hypothetical protein F937_03583 [Acinetobacter calcoaceticus ANC 3680]
MGVMLLPESITVSSRHQYHPLKNPLQWATFTVKF